MINSNKYVVLLGVLPCNIRLNISHLSQQHADSGLSNNEVLQFDQFILKTKEVKLVR